MKPLSKFIRILLALLIISLFFNINFKKNREKTNVFSPIFLIDTSMSMKSKYKEKQIEKIKNIKFSYNNFNKNKKFKRGKNKYYIFITDLYDNNFTKKNIKKNDKILLVGKPNNQEFSLNFISETKKNIIIKFKSIFKNSDSINVFVKNSKIKFAIKQNSIFINKKYLKHTKNKVNIKINNENYNFFIYLFDKQAINIIIGNLNLDTRFWCGILKYNFNVKFSRKVDTTMTNIWINPDKKWDKIKKSNKKLYILSDKHYNWLSDKIKKTKPDNSNFFKINFTPKKNYFTILKKNNKPFFWLVGDSIAIYSATNSYAENMKNVILKNKKNLLSKEILKFLNIFLKKQNFSIYKKNGNVVIELLSKKNNIDIIPFYKGTSINSKKYNNDKIKLLSNGNNINIDEIIFKKGNTIFDRSKTNITINTNEQKTDYVNSDELDKKINTHIIKNDSALNRKNIFEHKKEMWYFKMKHSKTILLIILLLFTFLWIWEAKNVA